MFNWLFESNSREFYWVKNSCFWVYYLFSRSRLIQNYWKENCNLSSKLKIFFNLSIYLVGKGSESAIPIDVFIFIGSEFVKNDQNTKHWWWHYVGTYWLPNKYYHYTIHNTLQSTHTTYARMIIFSRYRYLFWY